MLLSTHCRFSSLVLPSCFCAPYDDIFNRQLMEFFFDVRPLMYESEAAARSTPERLDMMAHPRQDSSSVRPELFPTSCRDYLPRGLTDQSTQPHMSGIVLHQRAPGHL